jgi:hypothetical protein
MHINRRIPFDPMPRATYSSPELSGWSLTMAIKCRQGSTGILVMFGVPHLQFARDARHRADTEFCVLYRIICFTDAIRDQLPVRVSASLIASSRDFYASRGVSTRCNRKRRAWMRESTCIDGNFRQCFALLCSFAVICTAWSSRASGARTARR